jgi:hypothetical protein
MCPGTDQACDLEANGFTHQSKRGSDSQSKPDLESHSDCDPDQSEFDSQSSDFEESDPVSHSARDLEASGLVYQSKRDLDLQSECDSDCELI